ncbi:probable phospholipid hydroperoxide glutathione peroxidase [Venturia canescens]|uniref:probable phospholipid hydroperoxide glutathione peroxidase n=1 Tax=Venturia canescens TaxID=32260 RepID=UPI001C9C26F8|nr:probable phospholipid hydroperoxide glutathione peroxidase [Venturia canescens]
MWGQGIIILTLVSLSVSTENCSSEKSDDCQNIVGTSTAKFNQDVDWEKATTIYQFQANDINGKNVSLDKYRGHVLVVVNVASNCGLTETNYRQLEALYEKYGPSKGLKVLAFPSNQFANQEPGTSADILNFVKKYNVQFDLFQKVDVNGDNAHPVWKWLKKQSGGFLTDEIKWNFSKFVIDKEGHVVSRFSPTTEPFSLEDTLKALF